MAKKWLKKGDTGQGYSNVPVGTGSAKLRRRHRAMLSQGFVRTWPALGRVARVTLAHWVKHMLDVHKALGAPTGRLD